MKIKNTYDISTYPQSTKNDTSDLEVEKNQFSLKGNINNNTDSEQEKFLEISFQPKCIFTKKNNNISFYQSTTKSSYRDLKLKKNLTPIEDYKYLNSKEKNIISRARHLGKYKFSYNYTATNSKSVDKTPTEYREYRGVNMNPNNLKYNLKLNVNNPKKFKKQYNIQKSDNFKMLSYKHIEFDPYINFDYNMNKDRVKLVQMYQREGMEDIYFPIKQAYSPPQSLNSELKNKYQTHTLKYQSFFGTFNNSKQNPKVAKSTSRLKKNQLSDFNIEKLIEIGDKYADFCKPVLPLGKKMNNNIIYYNNSVKNNKKKIPINSKNKYHNSINDLNPIINFTKINQKEKSKDFDDTYYTKSNILRDKKRVTKKIVSKNNLKYSINMNDDNNDVTEKEFNNTIKKILDFNSELKDTNNNFNNNIINRKKNTKKNDVKNANNNFNQKENLSLRENAQDKMIQNKENISNNTFFKKVGKNNVNNNELYNDDEKNNKNNYLYNKKIVSKNKHIMVVQNKRFMKNNKNLLNLYDKRKNTLYGYDAKNNLESNIY